MKVALIQFNATEDKEKNVRRAKKFVQQAILEKAQWILLPEVFNFRGDVSNKTVTRQIEESIPGETSQDFLEIAQKHNVAILLGSLLEKSSKKKAYNTSVYLNGHANEVKKYRKIHLFEAVLGDKILNEALLMSPGKKLQIVAVKEFKVGLSICYDLRFPDLYQQYAHQGAHVLTVPSCFTKHTGKAHWETLLRARAIENFCYVLAPNQVGRDSRGIESYGNSMIVGPWGEVIARGSADKEEIIFGNIFLSNVNEARRKLPGIIKE